MYRPIQWARQTVEGRQDFSNGSRLLNMYAERAVAPDESKVAVVLHGTPGAKRYANVTAGDGAAGIFGLVQTNTPTYGERLFGIVGGNYLFEIRAADVGAGVYDVPNAREHRFTREPDNYVSAPVRMTTDGQRILWVHRRQVLAFDMATDAMAAVQAPTADDPAADLPDEEWVDCDWVDGYFLVGARNGQFFNSLQNSLNFDQLDFARASYRPDELVALRVLRRVIYLFGRESIEQWYHSGGTDFPFTRDNTQSIDVGCAARDTVHANEDVLMFLGSDNIVYSMAGAPVRRSHETVEYDIARSATENARAHIYTEEGHRFYSLTLDLGAEGLKNWTLDLNTGLWHERTRTDVMCAERFQRRNLFGRDTAGNPGSVYDSRLDWGDEDGTAIERESIGPIIFANQQRAQCHAFLIDAPPRAGQPEDAIRLSWSDDGQRTWSYGGRDPVRLDAPRQIWHRLGQFRTRHFRLQTNARRRIDLLGAYADVSVGPD